MSTVMNSPLESAKSSLSSRQSAMVETLSAWIAIPTGHNHTLGLDEFRETILGRLRAIGASVSFIDGVPKEAWLGEIGRASCRERV